MVCWSWLYYFILFCLYCFVSICA